MTKRQLVPGIMGALFVIAGCADDPTSSLRQGIDAVTTSLNYVEIVVGETVPVTAVARDAQGNALAVLPTVTSANTAVATVSVDEEQSGQPAPRTVFTITAVSFGETVVIAEAEGLSDTITVRTVPDAVVISGAPATGTLTSGLTVQLTATVVDADGNTITGFTVDWAGGRAIAAVFTEEAVIATIDQTGLVTAQGPTFDELDSNVVSSFTVIATVAFDGIANGLFNTADLVAEVPIFVEPLPFTGTFTDFAGLSVSTVVTDQLLTITRGAGDPDFDIAATRVFLGTKGEATIKTATVSDMRVKLPPFTLAPGETVETVALVIANVGPKKLSFGTTIVKSLPSAFGGTTTDPLGGAVTAVAFGDTLVVKPGTIAWTGNESISLGGVFSTFPIGASTTEVSFIVPALSVGANPLLIATEGVDELTRTVDLAVTTTYTQNDLDELNLVTPAPDITADIPLTMFISLDEDNVDDFFTIAPAADLDVTVTFAWQNSADMDILWYGPFGGEVVCCFFNFAGATGANPEISSVSIPAGFVAVLNANAYDMNDEPATIIEITITSP